MLYSHLAVAVLAAAAATGVQQLRLTAERAEHGREIATLRFDAEHDLRLGEQRERAKESQHTKTVEALTRDAQAQIDTARAAARRTAADAGRLRQQAQALAATSGGTCAAASSAAPSSPASATTVVLADVLGRAAERAAELAEYADAARNAGATCAKAYDAVAGH